MARMMVFVCYGCCKGMLVDVLMLWWRHLHLLALHWVNDLQLALTETRREKAKVLFKPLAANDELSRLENLTLLWTWILKWVPRSFATHASLCNTLSSNKCPKTVKILAVKGLSSSFNDIIWNTIFVESGCYKRQNNYFWQRCGSR